MSWKVRSGPVSSLGINPPESTTDTLSLSFSYDKKRWDGSRLKHERFHLCAYGIVCNQKLIRALLYGDKNSLGFGLFLPEMDWFWKQDGGSIQGKKKAQRRNTKASPQWGIAVDPSLFSLQTTFEHLSSVADPWHLVRIRIRGSVPLMNGFGSDAGFGSWYFRHSFYSELNEPTQPSLDPNSNCRTIPLGLESNTELWSGILFCDMLKKM